MRLVLLGAGTPLQGLGHWCLPVFPGQSVAYVLQVRIRKCRLCPRARDVGREVVHVTIDRDGIVRLPSCARDVMQMIWSRTTAVGCGIANCRRGRIFACHYSPPGNVLGQLPYCKAHLQQIHSIQYT